MSDAAIVFIIISWISIGLGITRFEERGKPASNEVAYVLLVLLWPSQIVERAYADHVASQKTGRLH
jgi:hypothetical protein